MNNIIVIGAGGLGREVLDVIEAINAASSNMFSVVGIADDGPNELDLERLRRRNYIYLGTVEEAMRNPSFSKARYVIGIGNPSARQKIRKLLLENGKALETITHPTAVFGSEVSIGLGCVFLANTFVSTNVTIGENTVINWHTTIGHDSVIGADCVINPAANISGNVSVGDATLIGTGAQVLQNLQIGERVVVGASACVTKDLPTRAQAVGVPARWNSPNGT